MFVENTQTQHVTKVLVLHPCCTCNTIMPLVDGTNNVLKSGLQRPGRSVTRKFATLEENTDQHTVIGSI